MTDRRSAPRLDLRNRLGGWMLRMANPVTRRFVAAGLPTGAPNVLLTMKGRKSGKLRTVPVGIVELDGRAYIQSSYGETGWVANLRSNSEATLTRPGGQQAPVHAVELSPEEGGAVLRQTLRPFRRSRFLRVVLGPTFRPPIGVLWRLRLRVDDTPEEYTTEARRHPVFELRPIA